MRERMRSSHLRTSFAIEPNEYRGVRNGYGRLEHEDTKLSARFIDLVENGFVEHRLDFVVGKKPLDLVAIGGGSGGVIVGDKKGVLCPYRREGGHGWSC